MIIVHVHPRRSRRSPSLSEANAKRSMLMCEPIIAAHNSTMASFSIKCDIAMSTGGAHKRMCALMRSSEIYEGFNAQPVRVGSTISRSGILLCAHSSLRQSLPRQGNHDVSIYDGILLVRLELDIPRFISKHLFAGIVGKSTPKC